MERDGGHARSSPLGRLLGLLLGLLLDVGPFVILTVVACSLAMRWDAIPPRFPVHWGINGQPNGWSTRSVAGVFGPLLLAAAICAAIAAFRLVSVRSSGQRIALFTMLVTEYVVAIAISFPSMRPGEKPELSAILLATLPPIALVTLLTAWRPWGSDEPRAETGDYPSAWHIFPVYPGNPALWVPKRSGLGWTLNFAHPAAPVVLIALLAVVVGLAFIPRLLR